jgi:hypothetical protein
MRQKAFAMVTAKLAGPDIEHLVKNSIPMLKFLFKFFSSESNVDDFA